MKEYNINAILPKDEANTQKSFAVKYSIGNDYGKAFFDRDMRLGTNGRVWYVVGWGYARESGDFSRIRPLTLSLNSGSEISYNGKMYRGYIETNVCIDDPEEFKRLAFDFHKYQIEKSLEVL